MLVIQLDPINYREPLLIQKPLGFLDKELARSAFMSFDLILFVHTTKSPFFLDREPFNHQIFTSGGLVQRQDG